MINKTLTILFVDVQGYTSRTAQQTREENQLFVKEIQAFIERHVIDKGGQLVKTMGDGFLITFDSPTDAVNCGTAMQKEIDKRNANILNSDNFVKLRIGACTGEVNIDANGDVFGDAVNIAARIQKFAEPNDVFISEATYLAMNKVEIKTIDLGPQKFKNVLQEVRVYRVFKDMPQMLSPHSSKKIPPSKKILWLIIALAFILGFAILLKTKKDTTLGNYFPKKEIFSPEQTRRQNIPPNAEKIRQWLEEKKFDEIVKFGEEQLKSEPDNVKILGILGHSYWEIGNLDKAKEHLEKAVTLGTDAVPIYFDLARVYEQQGNYNKAIELLRNFAAESNKPGIRQRIKQQIQRLQDKIK